jgi:hypothetical protein
VILTETIDIRVGSDPRAAAWRFEFFDRAENRAIDPDTGEVLIDLPESALDENGNPLGSPYGLIQRVDDVLLVATGNRRLRFDLGQ